MVEIKVQPLYGAVVTVFPDESKLEIQFAEKPSKELSENLVSLEKALDTSFLTSSPSKPWYLHFSPVYDFKEICLVLEDIFKEHIKEVGSSMFRLAESKYKQVSSMRMYVRFSSFKAQER